MRYDVQEVLTKHYKEITYGVVALVIAISAIFLITKKKKKKWLIK